jgi:hypothetical protein
VSPSPNHVRTASLATLAAIAAPLLGACGTQNSTNTLIGAGEEPLPALAANPPSSIPAEATTSVDGLDRRNWPITTVDVPRGQVQVQPSYSENLIMASGASRDAGGYPTTSTALEGRSDGLSVLAEAGAQPFWSAGWVMVGGPIRMAIGEPPWAVQRNPRSDFALDDPRMGEGRDAMWHWVSRDPARGASLPMVPARHAAVGITRGMSPRAAIAPTAEPPRSEP